MSFGGFDARDLEELDRTITQIAEEIAPKEIKKFIGDQGNKLKKRLKARLKANFKKKTGNLTSAKRLKRSKVYKYKPLNATETRIFFAPHTNLLEYGHINVRNGKFVAGKHIVRTTESEFAKEFESEFNDLVDDILKDLS